MSEDMKPKKVRFPSASSMARKQRAKPRKKKKPEDDVRMMGLMAYRRGSGGEHGTF